MPTRRNTPTAAHSHQGYEPTGSFGKRFPLRNSRAVTWQNLAECGLPGIQFVRNWCSNAAAWSR